jgi:hypothetical protein
MPQHPPASCLTPRTRRWGPSLALSLALSGLLLCPTVQAGKHKDKAGADAAPAAPNPAIPDCIKARPCAVSVSGNQFLRDGKPWTPKGVVITGFLAPDNYIKGTYAKARGVWGERLLRQLQDIGVDTLRFNLSVAGLDPTNAMGDKRMDAAQKRTYLNQIIAAVGLAERFGMNSLLTFTTGDPTGFGGSEDVPGDETARAWAVLAPAFANRPSVFFNAFNEPDYGGELRIEEDASPWKRWHTGYSLMVDTIRKSGARNVIVLDGLSTSRMWRKNTDANVPRDPVGQLAYDIHPFPTDQSIKTKGGKPKLNYVSIADIEHALDGWCDRHACLASAFFTGSTDDPPKAFCYDGSSLTGMDSSRIAASYVDYFTRRHIGVLIFAGDWKHHVFDHPGEPGARLTSFSGFKSCQGDKNMGPGELMKSTWTQMSQ